MPGDIENNNGSAYGFGRTETREEALEKIRTAGTLSISPELFEKLYLTPKTPNKGKLRYVIGNPSPLGVWFGMGGILMLIASVLEFIIGNTFTGVSFGTYGGFWIAWAITITPFYAAVSSYEPENPANPGFHNSFAFALVFMAVPTFVFMIYSLRTNVVYVFLFFTIMLGFCLLAGCYWQLGQMNIQIAKRLQVAAGAVFFVTDLTGWYIFVFLMLASVEFPFNLPMGDISHLLRPKNTEEWDE